MLVVKSVVLCVRLEAGVIADYRVALDPSLGLVVLDEHALIDGCFLRRLCSTVVDCDRLSLYQVVASFIAVNFIGDHLDIGVVLVTKAVSDVMQAPRISIEVYNFGKVEDIVFLV